MGRTARVRALCVATRAGAATLALSTALFGSIALVLSTGAAARPATVTDSLWGLRVTTPSSWSSARLNACNQQLSDQAIFSNVPASAFHAAASGPGLCSTSLDVSGAPADFVLVQLSLDESFPPPPLEGISVDSRFPPALGRMSPRKLVCGCRAYSTELALHGGLFVLTAFVGPRASPASVEALTRVLSSIVPAPTNDARVVSVHELEAVAARFPRRVYWAGPRAGTRLELTRRFAGGVNSFYVRYLPPGVPAGSPYQFLSIETFREESAYERTRDYARDQVETPIDPGHGGAAIQIVERGTTVVYAAFPSAPGLLVVVQARSAAKARKLVASGAIVPVPT